MKNTEQILWNCTRVEGWYDPEKDTIPGAPIVTHTDHELLTMIQSLTKIVSELVKREQCFVKLEPGGERVYFEEVPREGWILFGSGENPSHGSGWYPVVVDGKKPMVARWNEGFMCFDFGETEPSHFIDCKLPEVAWGKGEEE